MKSIKFKALLAFCIPAGIIILVIAVLASLGLGVGIQNQSQILSKELADMSNDTLSGYHGLLRSSLRRVPGESESNSAAADSEGYKARVGKSAHYTGLLKEFYDTTGLACAVYSGSNPVAQAGFFIEAMENAGSTLIDAITVPGVSHAGPGGLYASSEGVEQVRGSLLESCKVWQ